MIQFFSAAWKIYAEDLLVFRIMFFNLGLTIAGLSIVEAHSMGTGAVADGASFSMLLGLMTLGALLICVSLTDTKRLASICAWLKTGDFWLIFAAIAVVTLSVHITTAIKFWRTNDP